MTTIFLYHNYRAVTPANQLHTIFVLKSTPIRANTKPIPSNNARRGLRSTAKAAIELCRRQVCIALNRPYTIPLCLTAAPINPLA